MAAAWVVALPDGRVRVGFAKVMPVHLFASGLIYDEHLF